MQLIRLSTITRLSPFKEASITEMVWAIAIAIILSLVITHSHTHTHPHTHAHTHKHKHSHDAVWIGPALYKLFWSRWT